MKKLMLLLCVMPLVAMDNKYVPISADDEGPAPTYEDAEITQRYPEVSKVLFPERNAQAGHADTEYVAREFIIRRENQRYLDAVRDLGLALQAQHKPAFVDAAQLALEMDMARHDSIMPVITPYAADMQLSCQDGLSTTDLVGLQLLLKADAINGTYDQKALALQKIALLDNWLAGKKELFTKKRDARVLCAQWSCIAGSTLAGVGAAGGIASLFWPSQAAIFVGIAAGFGSCAGACACAPCIDKKISNKFSEVQTVFAEVLTHNPQFIEGAVAELEAVAARDRKVASLLSKIYDHGLVVEYNATKMSRYGAMRS
jgi:hypothetical protein